MREKLNSNPLLQLAVVGVLLVGAGFFVLSSMGHGQESGSESESSTPAASTSAASSAVGSPSTAVAGTTPTASTTATAAAPAAGALQPPAGSAPAPPQAVLSAWNDNKTVVLLFVRDGGIDDRLVSAATRTLGGMPGVASFVVPAMRISRYAAVTEGVGVNRVPALVVLRPKHLDQTAPTASVRYGFQSAESIAQAVKDAGYKGPTLEYHP